MRHRVTKIVVPLGLAAGAALSAMSLSAPAASAATPSSYTVASGDTLAAIAPLLGTTWPALASYNHLANPNKIQAGEVLQAPPVGYSAATPSAQTASPEAQTTTHEPSSNSASPTRSSSGHPSSSASGSTASCIRASENGGSYGRSGNATHFGAYQFDRQTWAAHGGNPADWGSASAAEQDQVFANTVASSGYSAWTPYDGC
ncbi:MAG: LysM peptidoglycan-binding domain-containing protein [Actinomycetota bacterium]|nr:LysM peptidoglycan-binding domain-containing protein [Actinomycetota bacterium]